MTTSELRAELDAEDCLSVAERLFVRAIRALSEICDKLERDELEGLPTLKSAVPEAMQATKFLLQERNRVFELHKKKSGIVNDYVLDFDAARSEIGSRLARIREAGSG